MSRQFDHALSLYSSIARAYFKKKQVYRYHMKKIADMDDSEVIQKCHFWYTENNLEADYRAFEDSILKKQSPPQKDSGSSL